MLIQDADGDQHGWDAITLFCRAGVLARMRGRHVEECCGIFWVDAKAPTQGQRCGIAFSNQEKTRYSYRYRDDLMAMISDDVEAWSRTFEKHVNEPIVIYDNVCCSLPSPFCPLLRPE